MDVSRWGMHMKAELISLRSGFLKKKQILFILEISFITSVCCANEVHISLIFSSPSINSALFLIHYFKRTDKGLQNCAFIVF